MMTRPRKNSVSDRERRKQYSARDYVVGNKTIPAIIMPRLRIAMYQRQWLEEPMTWTKIEGEEAMSSSNIGLGERPTELSRRQSRRGIAFMTAFRPVLTRC